MRNFLSACILFLWATNLTTEAQHFPGDLYFSGSGPAYSSAIGSDIVNSYYPVTLSSSGYQWWAHNVPAGSGPRNAPPSRPEFGDLPPVEYEMADLRLPWAWTVNGPDGSRVSGKGVRVAVIDDGIDSNHPDFYVTSGLFTVMDPVSSHHKNFRTGFFEPQPEILSSDVHGTALAGIIAAQHGGITANLGLAGIAPGCTLQSLVAMKSSISETLWAEAFSYGSHIADTDGDGNLLDEYRSGEPHFDICLNASSNGVPTSASDLFSESLLWHRSIMHGATRGRGGKGVIYITSAGSGAIGHMNTNYADQRNSIFQIPVTAVTDMGRRIGNANPGANIVCAGLSRGEELPPLIEWALLPPNFPSNRPNRKGPPIEVDDVPWQWWRRSQGVPVLSTQAKQDFNFFGTGPAAAQVAGIVALMLEKRPDLKARDVKEILLRSGRVVNDARYDYSGQPIVAGAAQTYPWPASGPHPPATLPDGPTQWRMSSLGRPVHHALGAGLIDAHRALKIAERWLLLPAAPVPLQSSLLSNGAPWTISQRNRETGSTYFAVPLSRTIPTDGQAVSIILPPPPSGMKLEDIEVRVRCYHPRRGDLQITLIAPAAISWDRTTSMVSDLMLPHREDFHSDPIDVSGATNGSPMDWTFTTVRHWGAIPQNSGQWRLTIRDAIVKGATTVATASDPVVVPVENPIDPVMQKVDGVGVVYHGTNGVTPVTPVISSSIIRLEAAPDISRIPLKLAPLPLHTDGQPAFPVTSWDFFHTPDLVPPHAAAPPKSPFGYYPYGVSSVSVAPPDTALYPLLSMWPALPRWVPLTVPPAAGSPESSGAIVSRPRWAQLSSDGRFLVLRDASNSNAATNFIHARLNRATGELDVIPRNSGVFYTTVIAENLLGISQPQTLEISILNRSGSYNVWRTTLFTPAQYEDTAVSGPSADPDGDGTSNLLECLFKTGPLDPKSFHHPEPGIAKLGDATYATITFVRSASVSLPAVVEFSSGLDEWSIPAALLQSVTNPDGTITQTWRSTQAAGGNQTRLFGRVRTTL